MNTPENSGRQKGAAELMTCISEVISCCRSSLPPLDHPYTQKISLVQLQQSMTGGGENEDKPFYLPLHLHTVEDVSAAPAVNTPENSGRQKGAAELIYIYMSHFNSYVLNYTY